MGLLKLSEYKLFVKRALANPLQIATLAPTTKHLATRLLKISGVDPQDKILELGAGTGAITDEILKFITDGSQLEIVEVDPELGQHLKQKYLNSKIHVDCVERLDQFLSPGEFDKVIASLPWTLFPEDVQVTVLDQVHKALADGGRFVYFITLHAKAFSGFHKFQRKVDERFQQIHAQAIVLKNLPPAEIVVVSKSPQN